MKGSLFNIARNTGATVLIRGGNGIARILLLLLIAKRFGPEDFGRLSIVLSLVEIMRVLADFGLDVVTIRRFSVNKRLSSRLLGNVLGLKLINATIGYALSIVVYWILYHNERGVPLLFIIGTSLYTTLLINTFISYFQANLKMSSIIVSSLVSTCAYIILTTAGLYLGWSLALLALIIPGSELVNLLITTAVYRERSPVRFELNRRIVMSLLKESAPVAVGGIAVVLMLRTDNLMLGWFLGERSVGIYSAAYRFIEPFSLVFSSLSISVYASLSSLGKNMVSAESRKTLLRVITAVAGAGTLAACVLALFARPIMGLISVEYVSSIPVLQVLSLAIVFKAINAQLTAFVNATGRYGLISSLCIVNLVINTLLYLLLIPVYGIMGAAISIVITESFNTIMQAGLVFHMLRTGELADKRRSITI